MMSGAMGNKCILGKLLSHIEFIFLPQLNTFQSCRCVSTNPDPVCLRTVEGTKSPEKIPNKRTCQIHTYHGLPQGIKPFIILLLSKRIHHFPHCQTQWSHMGLKWQTTVENTSSWCWDTAATNLVNPSTLAELELEQTTARNKRQIELH